MNVPMCGPTGVSSRDRKRLGTCQIYFMLANGVNSTANLSSERNDAWMTTALAEGMDRIFQYRLRFQPVYERSTKCYARMSVHLRTHSAPGGGATLLPIPKTDSLLHTFMNQMGTPGIAQREIAALGGRDLHVGSDSITRFVSACPAVALYLFADDCDQYFFAVRCAAMFEQKNALPGSELHFSIANGHRLVCACQDHANV